MQIKGATPKKSKNVQDKPTSNETTLMASKVSHINSWTKWRSSAVEFKCNPENVGQNNSCITVFINITRVCVRSAYEGNGSMDNVCEVFPVFPRW